VILVVIFVAVLVERSPVPDEDYDKDYDEDRDCGVSRLFFAAKPAKKPRRLRPLGRNRFAFWALELVAAWSAQLSS